MSMRGKHLPRPCRGRERGRGFTLVELAVSIGVCAVLVIGLGSAVMIASRALDTTRVDTNGYGKLFLVDDALEQLNGDLRLALAFTEKTSTAVTFTVPDRNGDGQPETIRYAWSGKKDTPLTRSYNGGTPTTLAPEIRRFALSYQVQSIDPPVSPTPILPSQVESAEQVLISHDDAPGGNFKSQNIDKGHWAAQYFKPALPANAVRWKITRIKVRLRKEKVADGGLGLYVVNSVNNEPAYPIVDYATVAETTLGAGFAWIEFQFGSLSDLEPSKGYCLVVVDQGGNAANGAIEYEENGSPMTAGTHWMTSTDDGNTWTNPNSSQDMRIYIYGTVTTQ